MATVDERQAKYEADVRERLFVPETGELIPERIAKRAVEKFTEILRNPTFDNGDSSFGGFLAKSMQEDLAERSPLGDLDKFRQLLEKHIRCRRYACRYIDYGPDYELLLIAEMSGVPVARFPIKTSLSVDAHKFSLRVGYGAEHVYHYPMANGNWLLTTLTGSERDIRLIIELATEFPDRFSADRESA
jgi:hypothetical protein